MKKIFSIGIVIFAALPLMAQNSVLNQTVTVVNSFDNKLVNMERQINKLPVPDSLYHFDLNFDYSGFDTPYKGGTEFNPFFTDLEMSGRPYDGRKFYMKAGAGYVFAPFGSIYYTMKDQGKFKIGLHADGDGYLGSAGHDGKAVSGFDARLDWKSGSMLMLLDYEGAFGSGLPDLQSLSQGLKSADSKGYNGMNFQLGINSNYNPKSGWRFVADFGYAFGAESVKRGDLKSSLMEHNPRIRFFGRYDFKNGSAIDLELSGNATLNRESAVAGAESPLMKSGFTVMANPRYFYNYEKVSLGVGVGILFNGLFNLQKDGKVPFMVWPTLDFQWAAVKGKLDIYANADINGYMYGSRADALENRLLIPFRDADIEYRNIKNMQARAGLRGRLGHKFDYDVFAGFRKVENDPLYFVDDATGALSLVYDDTRRIFAGTRFSGTFGGFSLKGDFLYNFFFNQHRILSRPSEFIANLDMKYTILRRISFGVGAEYRSSYRAGSYNTPFILDLRALAEYKVSSSFSVFITGSNLLRRQLQYTPLYSRKGVCITGGIVLNI